MSFPVALGRYADDIIGGNYRDKDRMWARVVDTDKQLVATLRAHPTGGKLKPDVRAKLEAVHKSFRKGGANRGHRSGALAPKPVSTTKALAKGVPQLDQMKIIDYRFTVDEEDYDEVSFDEMTTYEKGWCRGTRNKTATVLFQNMEEEPYATPAGILVKEAAFENESSETKKKLVKRYRPHKIAPLFDDQGILRQVECLFFQLGAEDVTPYMFSAPVKKVVTESSKYVQISIQFPNLSNKADFDTTGKSTFVKDAIAACGTKNIHGDSKPILTNTLKNTKYKKDASTCTSANY
jgi:hypothetical protein